MSTEQSVKSTVEQMAARSQDVRDKLATVGDHVEELKAKGLAVTPADARRMANEAKVTISKDDRHVQVKTVRAAGRVLARKKEPTIEDIAGDVAGESVMVFQHPRASKRKAKHAAVVKTRMQWIASDDLDLDLISTPQLKAVAKLAKEKGEFTTAEMNAMVEKAIKDGRINTVQSAERIWAWYRATMIYNNWIAKV